MRAENLKPFYHRVFGVEELLQYFKESPSSLRVQLSRLCKDGKLVRLKRNCYTFPDFHPPVMVIAQNMVSPSYHSLESVLSQESIIPESVVAHTLITSKKTQVYANEFGTFSYRHLPPDSFFGVEENKEGAWVAVPEKALLDYLYLNSRKFEPKTACWQAQRFDELDSLDWKTMKKWAKRYDMKKLSVLVKSLESYAKSGENKVHL